MKTTVKYTKDKATISMDLDQYKRICLGFNKLRDALMMVSETHDLYISDIRKLDELSYAMMHLGFERGEHHWTDVTIPKEDNAKSKRN
jgi:hypothetical protein|tara:strand:- start:154 stop:417 length:264 start_codon:yes stop_codon:yes gene_type:complete